MIVTHVRFQIPVRVRTSPKGAGEDMSGWVRPVETESRFTFTYSPSTSLLCIEHIPSGCLTFVARENLVWWYAEPEETKPAGCSKA